jgi:ABC-type lipoprotein release transport system permease subunit
VVGGLILVEVVGAVIQEVHIPGALPIVGAAVLLAGAAVLASVVPAARAARVDVMEALRSE